MKSIIRVSFFAWLTLYCDVHCWSFSHQPQTFPGHPASAIAHGTALCASNPTKSIVLNNTGSKGKTVKTGAEALTFTVNSEINEFQNSLIWRVPLNKLHPAHRTTRAHPKALSRTLCWLINTLHPLSVKCIHCNPTSPREWILDIIIITHF